MTTRVIIHLAGGDYANSYFPSPTEAREFVKRWATSNMESMLIADAQYTFAVLATSVIGMHIPDDANSAAQRTAAAVEQLAQSQNDGDAWKQ